MSPAGEEAALAQARRMTPVLERLRRAGDIEPQAVREELLKLVHRPDRLRVRPMHSRYEDTGYVTPPGAPIGLSVGGRACVTGHVDADGSGVRASGPSMETGCLPPPVGH